MKFDKYHRNWPYFFYSFFINQIHRFFTVDTEYPNKEPLWGGVTKIKVVVSYLIVLYFWVQGSIIQLFRNHKDHFGFQNISIGHSQTSWRSFSISVYGWLIRSLHTDSILYNNKKRRNISIQHHDETKCLWSSKTFFYHWRKRVWNNNIKVINNIPS